MTTSRLAAEEADEQRARHRRGYCHLEGPVERRVAEPRSLHDRQLLGHGLAPRPHHGRHQRTQSAQCFPLPGDGQSRLAQRRPAVAGWKRHAPDEPAAGAGPALHAHRVRVAGPERRDPARVCDATAARDADADARPVAHGPRRALSGDREHSSAVVRQPLGHRSGGPGGVDQNLARLFEHGRSFEDVDGDAGALPPDHGLPGFRGADSGHGFHPVGASGAQAR